MNCTINAQANKITPHTITNNHFLQEVLERKKQA